MRDIHTSTITDAIQDSFRGRFVPPTASSSWPRTGKHVVSYIGLAPAISASADKYRLGHISQQGSALAHNDDINLESNQLGSKL